MQHCALEDIGRGDDDDEVDDAHQQTLGQHLRGIDQVDGRAELKAQEGENNGVAAGKHLADIHIHVAQHHAQDEGDDQRDDLHDLRLTETGLAIAPAMANAELKELNDSCPRALTIGQQGRLALYAAEHVLEDGRFCGILISLYTGIRPAECRGLRWNDFRSFPDHPDRHYLKVDEILNDKLEYSRQLKTKNALRCIPVHIEIEGALQKRKKFVQQNMGENTDIGELPIVCFENEFKDPCRGPDYSNFAFKLLKEFGVSSEQLGFSLLDEFDNLTPSDSHPPMRILRRNFATVIQACTDLSLEEKEYIFGHRISGKDGAKKRIEYNRNMDRLWRIAQKLDKAPFCKKLYELHFPQIIVGDGIVVQEGRGQGTIRIPWESAVYWQKLHLHFEGGPNTSVSISTPNAVRPFGGLPVEVKMADAPISWGDPLPPINAEAMHWEAVRKVRYLKKTDK